MTLKKKFNTESAATEVMYKLRRAGADAFSRGRYVTAIVNSCGEAMSAFGDWQVIKP